MRKMVKALIELRKADITASYMADHHEITETAIGLARLHLQAGRPEDASEALDQACDDIDAAHEVFLRNLGIEK